MFKCARSSSPDVQRGHAGMDISRILISIELVHGPDRKGAMRLAFGFVNLKYGRARYGHDRPTLAEMRRSLQSVRESATSRLRLSVRMLQLRCEHTKTFSVFQKFEYAKPDVLVESKLGVSHDGLLVNLHSLRYTGGRT